jgi:hypothetical protein
LNDQGTAPPAKSVRNASRARWCVKEISWLIVNPKSDQLQLDQGGTGAHVANSCLERFRGPF